MDVVDYENVVETPLNVADSNNAWASTVSSVPWVNSPMIDASVSVTNIPAQDPSWPDIAWWSTDIVRSATDYNTVAWTAGAIKLADGTSYSIDAGNTGNISAVNYIYADIATPSATLLKTTTAATSVWTGKLLLCVAQNNADTSALAKFQAFGTLGLGVFITADNIAANTITANEIASNTITATQMNVSQLSAISADMWSITAGTITGATIRTAASGQRVVLDTSLLTFYDWTGTYVGIVDWEVVGSEKFLFLWAQYSAWVIWVNRVLIWTDSWWYILLDNDTRISDKLKIPVWTNLY